MVQISQLILGETGCVSYIIYCKKEKEAVIVDSFQGFETIVEKELKKLHNPQIKYVIDTHTHADRKSASLYFSEKHETAGIVKSNKTKYKGKRIGTNDEDILKIGTSNILVLFTPGHTYDHNCYLIDGKNLLSGDCLFIGDVGRIDLGGNLKEKDVLEKIDTGLYLGNLHYLNWSDNIGGRITGMTRYACFWVENGEVVAPIENMRFDDSIYNFFGNNLEAVTDKSQLIPTVQTYDGREFGGVSCPGILLKSFELTL